MRFGLTERLPTFLDVSTVVISLRPYDSYHPPPDTWKKLLSAFRWSLVYGFQVPLAPLQGCASLLPIRLGKRKGRTPNMVNVNYKKNKKKKNKTNRISAPNNESQ